LFACVSYLNISAKGVSKNERKQNFSVNGTLVRRFI